jgi:hypothetical protein
LKVLGELEKNTNKYKNIFFTNFESTVMKAMAFMDKVYLTSSGHRSCFCLKIIMKAGNFWID